MRDRPAGVSVEALLRHRGWVRSLARELARDEASADDLEQEVWLTALRRPPARGGSLLAWLGRVVRSRVADAARSEGARGRREAAVARPEEEPSTARLAALAELQSLVARAVVDLEEPYRSTVLFRHFEELPVKEVARRTGVPLETARTRLRRAHALLRARLDAARGGDRDAWSAILLPLAGRPAESIPATAIPWGALLVTAKAKTALAAGAVLLVAFVAWRLAAEDAAVPPEKWPAPTEARGRPVLPVDSPGAAPSTPPGGAGRSGEPSPPAVRHLVRGTVVDEEGKGIPGAPVLVAGEEDPFEGMAEGGRPMTAGTADGTLRGREIVCDKAGRFEVGFPARRRIHLLAGIGSVRVKPLDPRGRWVETPAEGVVLRARTVPTATVVVRVRDLSTGTALRHFQVAVSGSGYFQHPAEGEEARVEVPVPEGRDSASLRVALVDPPPPEPVVREVVAVPGGVHEVTLATRSGEEVRGRVLSGEGTPLEGALVFFGAETRARGDEPFKPFDERRIRDGARTDATGAFALRGHGRVVTAWHPDHSPATVPLATVGEIRLPSRASLRGRLVDAGGDPVAGAEVALDRARKATTDDSGCFSFEAVEAGVRGLFLPGRRYVAVRVAPGEEAEVAVGPGLAEVRFELRSAGSPSADSLQGVLVGLDRVASLHEIRGSEGGSFTAKAVLPGRFLLLSREGPVAEVVVDGPAVEVDLGTTPVEVRAPARTRVFVAPEAADDLVLLMAARVGGQVPAEGKPARFLLPTGRYSVGIEGRGILRTFAVEEEPITVDLGGE